MSEQDEIVIESYCVSCKQTGPIQNPIAVWTSQGRPGTRGECSFCNGTVFRMGRTELHGNAEPPKAVQVIPKTAKGRGVKAAYIASDVTQSDFAEKLGQDLQNIGIHIWIDDGEQVDSTQWSSGVHPALEQCTHLVVILSSFTGKTGAVKNAWEHFLKKRKPIVIAQLEADSEPPDDLRSRPRFNFSEDYKTAFRGIVEALSR